MSLIEVQADLVPEYHSFISFTNRHLQNHSQQQQDSPDVGPSGRNMQSDRGGVGQITIISRRSLTWKSSLTCALQHSFSYSPQAACINAAVVFGCVWICLDQSSLGMNKSHYGFPVGTNKKEAYFSICPSSLLSVLQCPSRLFGTMKGLQVLHEASHFLIDISLSRHRCGLI